MSPSCQRLFRDNLIGMPALIQLLTQCEKQHIALCMQALVSDKTFELSAFTRFVDSHTSRPAPVINTFYLDFPPLPTFFSPVDPKYLRGGYGRETYQTTVNNIYETKHQSEDTVSKPHGFYRF